jgi:hypothetical protein
LRLTLSSSLFIEEELCDFEGSNELTKVKRYKSRIFLLCRVVKVFDRRKVAFAGKLGTNGGNEICP